MLTSIQCIYTVLYLVDDRQVKISPQQACNSDTNGIIIGQRTCSKVLEAEPVSNEVDLLRYFTLVVFYFLLVTK